MLDGIVSWPKLGLHALGNFAVLTVNLPRIKRFLDSSKFPGPTDFSLSSRVPAFFNLLSSYFVGVSINSRVMVGSALILGRE